jgi:hypothetical protein
VTSGFAEAETETPSRMNSSNVTEIRSDDRGPFIVSLWLINGHDKRGVRLEANDWTQNFFDRKKQKTGGRPVFLTSKQEAQLRLTIARRSVPFFLRTNAFKTASSLRGSIIMSPRRARPTARASLREDTDCDCSACTVGKITWESDPLETAELFMHFGILDFDLNIERQFRQLLDGNTRHGRD